MCVRDSSGSRKIIGVVREGDEEGVESWDPTRRGGRVCDRVVPPTSSTLDLVHTHF